MAVRKRVSKGRGAKRRERGGTRDGIEEMRLPWEKAREEKCQKDK